MVFWDLLEENDSFCYGDCVLRTPISPYSISNEFSKALACFFFRLRRFPTSLVLLFFPFVISRVVCSAQFSTSRFLPSSSLISFVLLHCDLGWRASFVIRSILHCLEFCIVNNSFTPVLLSLILRLCPTLNIISSVYFVFVIQIGPNL